MNIFSLSEKSIKTIKSITNSTYLDVIGLIIVISASLALDYHKNGFQFYISATEIRFLFGVPFHLEYRLFDDGKSIGYQEK